MAAGRRDTKIRFERGGYGTDEYGESIKVWAQYGHPEFAQVFWGAGSERRGAGQMRAAATATFAVLQNSQTAFMTTSDRIIADGRMWDITGIVPSSRQRGLLEFTAVEVGPVLTITPTGNGTLEFSDPANSGLLALIF